MLIIGVAADLSCRATDIISIAAGSVLANFALVSTVVFFYKVRAFWCRGLVVAVIMAVIVVDMASIVSVSVSLGILVPRIMFMAVAVGG